MSVPGQDDTSQGEGLPSCIGLAKPAQEKIERTDLEEAQNWVSPGDTKCSGGHGRGDPTPVAPTFN